MTAPSGSPRAEALRLEPEQPEQALQRVRSAEAEGLEGGRLDWLAARLLLRLGRPEEALAPLSKLAGSEHPLAPWAAVRAAEALLALPEPEAGADPAARAAFRRHGEAALKWAEQALRQGGNAVRPRARWLRVRALLRVQPARGETMLRELAGREDRWGSLAAAKLATRLQDSDRRDLRLEAVTWWARVARRDLDRAPGRALRAARAALALAEKLPRRLVARRAGHSRRELRKLLADALLAAGRPAEAARFYDAAARGLPAGGARWCEAKLGQGRALYRARQRAGAERVLGRVVARCRRDDVRAPAHFLRGRSLSHLGRYAEAIGAYEALVREQPRHRLADDAGYRAALAERERGRKDAARRRLARLTERHPDGDVTPRVLLELALHALDEGRPRDAQRYLERLGRPEREADREGREGREGRSDYWRAVALRAAGRTDEALDRFEQLARRYPLAFYARLALERLEEAAPDRAQAVLDTWRAHPPDEPLRFPERVLPERRDAFTRALELLAVREEAPAMAELREAGLLGTRTAAARRWLAVALLHAAGLVPRALRLVRRMRWTYFRQPPQGAHWWRWRLAYPEAFADEVRPAARAAGVPAALLFAAAREESGFDPRAVSRVGARGLTQLMPATATRTAARLGMPAPSPADLLRRPALNLRLGAGYLGWLLKRFAARPALVPAAYNAGERAVERWLRQGRGGPRARFDRFVEAIPYDETRRYGRRVLQSWGVYAWLRGQPLPPLGPDVPSSSAQEAQGRPTRSSQAE